MTRHEEHFDAMLRHLGAAYYQTVHGDGTAADLHRALHSAEAADGRGGRADTASTRYHSGRWRVGDVMTTDVVTIARATSYKEVARIMTEQKVNAMPVVTADGHVLGMVSEADVLRKEERLFRRLGTGLPRRSRRERAQALARNAGELMTTPAITIHAEAKLGAARPLPPGRRRHRAAAVAQVPWL